MNEKITRGKAMTVKQFCDALTYAIDILEAEAEIRDNDGNGNRIMKRHTKILKRVLSAMSAESREGKS